MISILINYSSIKKFFIFLQASEEPEHFQLSLFFRLKYPPLIKRKSGVLKFYNKSWRLPQERKGNINGERIVKWIENDAYMTSKISQSPYLRVNFDNLPVCF